MLAAVPTATGGAIVAVEPFDWGTHGRAVAGGDSAQTPSARPTPRPRMPPPWPPHRRPSASPAAPCWRDPAPLRSRVRASSSSAHRFYELGAHLHRATQGSGKTTTPCGQRRHSAADDLAEARPHDIGRPHGRASCRPCRAPPGTDARRSLSACRPISARSPPDASARTLARAPTPNAATLGHVRPYGVCSSAVSCAADTSAGGGCSSDAVESPSSGVGSVTSCSRRAPRRTAHRSRMSPPPQGSGRRSGRPRCSPAPGDCPARSSASRAARRSGSVARWRGSRRSGPGPPPPRSRARPPRRQTRSPSGCPRASRSTVPPAARSDPRDRSPARAGRRARSQSPAWPRRRRAPRALARARAPWRRTAPARR